MLRSYKAQLISICVFSLLVFPIVMLTSSSIIRTIFAFPVAFFLPGYTLLLTFYPRRDSMSGIERLLFSFVLSLAVVPLILLALNYIWNLDLFPSLITTTIFTLLMAIIAWWRQRQLLSYERFTITFNIKPTLWLPGMLKSRRFMLWLLLIALTVSILLFPVKITLAPSPVQSVNIFASFPLFIALFLSWMATLLFLLFSPKNGVKNSWERLALICIFSLVFLGYWTILTPNSVGGDAFSNLGTVRYLQLGGKITYPPVRYLIFPGVFLFTNFISQFSKLDIFSSGNLLIIFNLILFCALIHHFFARLIKNSYAASLALLIAAMLGQLIRTDFRLDTLGYVLLAGLLVLLTWDEQTPITTPRDILINVILLVAVTITYLMHSGLFFFILLGIIIMQVLGKKRDIRFIIPILLFIIILSWEIYWATPQFTTIGGYIPSLLERLKSLDFIFTAEQQQNATMGVGIPLWAVVTRYFRLVSLYGLGTILGFIGLARFKKLNSSEKIVAGGFLGVGLLSILLLVLYPTGNQYVRYFWYEPIFLAPIIVMFCFRQVLQRYITIAMITLLFITSLPIFLTNGSSISAVYVSPAECAAGAFLNSQYGEGDGLTVYSNINYGGDLIFYYALNATGKGPPEYSYIKDKDVLLEDVQKLVEEFQNSSGNSIYIYSERNALAWYGIFGIKPDDSAWQNIKTSLAGENGENILYSNDYIHIYTHNSLSH